MVVVCFAITSKTYSQDVPKELYTAAGIPGFAESGRKFDNVRILLR